MTCITQEGKKRDIVRVLENYLAPSISTINKTDRYKIASTLLSRHIYNITPKLFEYETDIILQKANRKIERKLKSIEAIRAKCKTQIDTHKDQIINLLL